MTTPTTRGEVGRGDRSRTSTPSMSTRPDGRVVQAGDQRGERGLAAAGLADEGQRGAGRDVQVDVGEHRRGRASYAKPTSSKRTSPRDAGRGATGSAGSSMSTGRSRYSKIRLNRASDAVTSTPDVEQPHQRAEERALEGGEGDQGADGHPAGGRREAGGEVDRGRDGGEDDGHGGHPPAAGELRADLEVDEVVRGRGEAVAQARGRAEGLGEQDAADRERPPRSGRAGRPAGAGARR